MRVFKYALFMMIIMSSFLFSQTVIKQKLNMSVDEATEKLTNNLKSKNMTVFAVIDHAQNAQNASLNMPSSKLVVFGNAKVGTSLMNDDMSLSYELPLKIAIYQDKQGQVWAYTKTVSQNINLSEDSKKKINAINNTLNNLVNIE